MRARLFVLLAFALLALGVRMGVSSTAKHGVPAPGFAIAGFGAGTTGGEGYGTLTVTTLTDSAADGECGPHCSFRDFRAACIAAGGCKLALAALSGNVSLASPLVFDMPNATLDFSVGAANQGIQFLGFPLEFKASNTIVRHLRVRSSTGGTGDCISVLGPADGISLSHVSASACTDGAIDFGDGPGALTNVSLEYSILAETEKAMLISSGVTGCTIRRNLFVHNTTRSPNFGAVSVIGGITAQECEFTENLVHNFISATEIRSNTPLVDLLVNIRRNLYSRGSNTTDTHEKLPVRAKALACSDAQCTGVGVPCALCCAGAGDSTCDDDGGRAYVYSDGNVLRNTPSGALWSAQYGTLTGRDYEDANTTEETNTPNSMPTATCATPPCVQRVATPYTRPTPPTASAAEILADVLANAGAKSPCRDSADAGFVTDATNGTGPALPAPFGTPPTLTGACP